MKGLEGHGLAGSGLEGRMSGGKPVCVVVIYWPSACVDVACVQMGLSLSSDVTSPSRRVLSRALSGQTRMACSKISGAEPHQGHVVSGWSSYQEGCAAR